MPVNKHTDLVPLSAQLPADRRPEMVYLMRLAPGSRPAMRGALQIISELLTGGRCDWQTLPWHLLGPQHTNALRADLANRYAHTTVNKMLAALRGVLRACWELGVMETDQYQRAIAVRSVRGETLPRGRALSSGELRSLFAACEADHSPAGRRDAALLAVLYGSGLRRAEAVALDVSDYDHDSGSLTVRSGKGNKARVSYTATGEGALIEAWLRVRGAAPGPLFCPVFKGGHVKIRRLDSTTVLDIARRRAVAAGVKSFSPHDMRRTMIGDLLDAGADIVTVQKLAGHANVQTTARYDRRGEAVKKKAAKMLQIPSAREDDGRRTTDDK